MCGVWRWNSICLRLEVKKRYALPGHRRVIWCHPLIVLFVVVALWGKNGLFQIKCILYVSSCSSSAIVGPVYNFRFTWFSARGQWSGYGVWWKYKTLPWVIEETYKRQSAVLKNVNKVLLWVVPVVWEVSVPFHEISIQCLDFQSHCPKLHGESLIPALCHDCYYESHSVEISILLTDFPVFEWTCPFNGVERSKFVMMGLWWRGLLRIALLGMLHT